MRRPLSGIHEVSLTSVEKLEYMLIRNHGEDAVEVYIESSEKSWCGVRLQTPGFFYLLSCWRWW